MKTTLTIISMIIYCTLSAQNYTLNWGSSFGAGWAETATSGSANNIGGSGINCGVSITKSGGIFTNVYGTYGGPATPTVASSTFVVPSSSNNIQISLDYSNPSQYTLVTFTFSNLVYNVRFKIVDIDRLTNTSNSYYDRITISGSNSIVTLQPTITKYDVSDPNFLLLSTGQARVNTGANLAGNTMSDASDQKGTINVDFKNNAINSFTIRYDNSAGVAADPGVQNIGIGNISFYRTPVLPVQLTAFEGTSTQGRNLLTWETAAETEMDQYVVEGSENGQDFRSLGTVRSRNNSANKYSFTDANPASGKMYYRLKLINLDGSSEYSKVIVVASSADALTQVFPTLVTDKVNIKWQSGSDKTITAFIRDMSGRVVNSQQLKAKKGTNHVTLPVPGNLPQGQYLVSIADAAGIRIFKQ